MIDRIASESPTICQRLPASLRSRSLVARSSRFSSSSRRLSWMWRRIRSTLSTEISSLSSRYGSLVMKSTAPAFTAATASSIVPWPVRMMIGRSGWARRIEPQISIPVRLPRPRSRSSTTISASPWASHAIASSPSSKLTTSRPRARNMSPSSRRTSA
jgi:hypothetical protein